MYTYVTISQYTYEQSYKGKTNYGKTKISKRCFEAHFLMKFDYSALEF